jgi:hypothetical protein
MLLGFHVKNVAGENNCLNRVSGLECRKIQRRAPRKNCENYV